MNFEHIKQFQEIVNLLNDFTNETNSMKLGEPTIILFRKAQKLSRNISFLAQQESEDYLLQGLAQPLKDNLSPDLLQDMVFMRDLDNQTQNKHSLFYEKVVSTLENIEKTLKLYIERESFNIYVKYYIADGQENLSQVIKKFHDEMQMQLRQLTLIVGDQYLKEIVIPSVQNNLSTQRSDELQTRLTTFFTELQNCGTKSLSIDELSDELQKAIDKTIQDPIIRKHLTLFNSILQSIADFIRPVLNSLATYIDERVGPSEGVQSLNDLKQSTISFFQPADTLDSKNLQNDLRSTIQMNF